MKPIAVFISSCEKPDLIDNTCDIKVLNQFSYTDYERFKKRFLGDLTPEQYEAAIKHLANDLRI